MKSKSGMIEAVTIIKEQYMTPGEAYPLIESIRSSFNVSALGLNAVQAISTRGSLLTTITVEGFCSLLMTILLITELVNVTKGPAKDADEPFIGGRELYLGFRACCILASITGVSFIASVLPAEINSQNTTLTTQPSQSLSTVGFIAIGLSIFTTHVLNARYPKSHTEKSLAASSTDEHTSEMKVLTNNVI